MHVYQLCRKVEIALEIGCINDVDDHVWRFLHKLFAHVEFLRTIGREAVCAGKVNKMELVTLVVGAPHLGIYRHTRVVPDTLMCTGSKVEERRLATVWVTNECHIDDFALAIGGIGEFGRRQCVVRFIRDIIGEGTLLRFIISLSLFHLACLFSANNLDLVGFTVSQAHLVAHDFIFNRVTQRCIQQHFNLLSLYESHFNDSFSEASMTQNLHNNTCLSGL